MSNNISVITIDGPSGSGKGTISVLLAKKLGWHFLDSGSLYRVLALAALQNHIADDNEAELVNLAKNLNIVFQVSLNSLETKIILDDKNVSDLIRTEECGKRASLIGAFAKVREALLQRQQDFRKAPGLVADGRDMGTVVFPDAKTKVFLTASVEERAKRRYNQLREKGHNVSLDALVLELKERDERDTQRSAAPLKPAEDATIIDTTSLTVEQVLQQVLSLAKE